MTKDDLIREYRNRAASWHAVAGVYGVIVGGLAVSASMML